jgi:hypothetical protein
LGRRHRHVTSVDLGCGSQPQRKREGASHKDAARARRRQVDVLEKQAAVTFNNTQAGEVGGDRSGD